MIGSSITADSAGIRAGWLLEATQIPQILLESIGSDNARRIPNWNTMASLKATRAEYFDAAKTQSACKAYERMEFDATAVPVYGTFAEWRQRVAPYPKYSPMWLR